MASTMKAYVITGHYAWGTWRKGTAIFHIEGV